MTTYSAKNASRRSFLIKASAACALTALPFETALARSSAFEPLHWRGAALGAEGAIELHHSDRETARAVLDTCRKEIDRLERLFSLYQPDSQLSRLNKLGYLEYPDLQFLELLSAAQGFASKTQGVFDITVQPLWAFYRDFYADLSHRGKVPAPSDLQRVLKQVGYQNLVLSETRIEFKKPGMAITLNGIAQGYITDRIKSILQDAGYRHVLLSLGEIAAIGPKQTGQPWKVGLEAGPTDPKSSQRIISLEDQAVATSGAYNSPFGTSNGANHLLNPKTGAWSTLSGSISVVSDTAMMADMYSTALALMTEPERHRLLSDTKQVQAVYFSSSLGGRNWSA
ncbi:FAD:protein FMN transferase [Sneathiella aquimaris]|uniref:FAD:protein FMN transferase n=1 Tax=Sneathiella aquimaris TaxID=2599305 RepID=UPI002260BCA1|nr:FAD:protein FMN transferase [Sneathiella aquimaris]